MLEIIDPNLVDPVTKLTDDVITWTFNVCAVIVPVDVISPVTTTEPEVANEPVNTIVSTLADNTVPLPVILTDPVTPKDPVIWVEPEIVVLLFTLNP